MPRSAKETNGAYAIVLSGGYVDDEDNGMSFWYTGEGGQDKGKQVWCWWGWLVGLAGGAGWWGWLVGLAEG